MEGMVAQSYKSILFIVLEMTMSIAALLGLEVWRQNLKSAWTCVKKSA